MLFSRPSCGSRAKVPPRNTATAGVPNQNLHAYEGTTGVPGSVSDTLTGATLGLSSVWPVSKRANVMVTFPDGKSQRFDGALVGTGWKYEGSKRRFVVTFASVDSRDQARITFRETTEP